MARAVTMMRLALCAGLMAGLAGCDEDGFGFGSGSGDGGAQTAGAGDRDTVQLVERDVEAPEVFQVSAQGLWDGRPSLGGVWVAHPDVGDPERVIIRNEDTDTFVIGALFRRERENPGPPLQVSSDAAAALGMIAGQPAALNVTALRREEAPDEPAAADADADAAPAQPADGPIAQTTLEDIGEVADGALARAEGAGDASDSSAGPPPQAPPRAAAEDATELDRPFIQIGIFSMKANAEGAGEQMRAAGMVPTIREESSQGQTFWRVIVGPARNADERATLLAQVRDLGFADAYAVRR